MNKAHMLTLVQEGQVHFASILARLTEAQMTDVKLHGAWTVKDVLAHIQYWEQFVLTLLRAAAEGQPPDMPHFTEEQVDRLNGDVFARNCARALSDVRADFRQTQEQLLAALQALPDDPNDQRWALWRDREQPWMLIANNTYEHYEEHLVPILALLDRGKS
jgi:hypothetical protein